MKIAVVVAALVGCFPWVAPTRAADVIIDQGVVVLNQDVAGDLIVVNPGTVVFLQNQLIDGDVTVTNEAQVIVERPLPVPLIIAGEVIVTDGAAVNFLPPLDQSEPPVSIDGNIFINGGGGGFLNRCLVLGNVEVDDAASFFLGGSSLIVGDIEITGTPVISLESTGVQGDVLIMQNVLLSDQLGGLGFADIGFFTANIIGGDLKIKQNSGGAGAVFDGVFIPVGLAVGNNTVDGKLEVKQNEITATMIVEQNQVDGKLEVKQNSAGDDLSITDNSAGKIDVKQNEAGGLLIIDNNIEVD